ncbi:MAG TPA: ribonuclease J, partial [Devosia sp.]|nr:ribonuclease J [Devosia sp.]
MSSMPTDLPDELVFLPLGGVGEIGMNMAAYGLGPENNRKWLVVDCGVTFGGPDLPGIELIMADPSFLEERADRVVGLVLTHAHEDHYGAVLDLWPAFDRPVFATPFAAAMLRAKRAADGITEHVPLNIIQPGRPFDVGPFNVEAISVTHSIPESCSLHISTPAGRVLHTGDWKIEDNPVSGPATNVRRFQEIGDMEGRLALICDSTNALKEGVSPTEREIARNLESLISEAENRVVVTSFASNLGRMISVARAAKKAGRQVVLSGRSMHRIATIGRELGLMDDIDPFLDHDSFRHLPRNKVVALCTGSQGEARAAISRISRDAHPAISLDRGDRMIFSSWAIPGNEREVIDIQNRLIDMGVEVITNTDELVHVTGHPRRGELRKLYQWLKPDTLVPVHGEAAHLNAQAQLGREAGIANVVNMRNGDMVRLFPDVSLSRCEIPAGELYLDGEILCTPDESGVRARKRLSFGGVV